MVGEEAVARGRLSALGHLPPPVLAGERVLPVVPALTAVFTRTPGLRRGATVVVDAEHAAPGAVSLALALVAEASAAGHGQPEVGPVGPRPARPQRDKDAAPLARPGRQAPAVASPEVGRGMGDDQVDRIEHGPHDGDPLRRRDVRDQGHPLQPDAELGCRQQPEVGDAHDGSPRAGSRRLCDQGEGE